MDASRFDRLARDVSITRTRRAVVRLLRALPLVGALALLPGDLPEAVREAEAARPVDRVQRRADNRRQRRQHRLKHRRKVRRRDKDPEPNPWYRKGITMFVYNKLPQRVIAELGIVDFDLPYRCVSPAIFDMPPLTGSARYDTEDSVTYSWIEGRYFIGFENPTLGSENMWVSDGGNAHYPYIEHTESCKFGGKKILSQNIETHEIVTARVDNRKFVITRHPDTKNKVFTVDVFENTP